MVRSSTPLPVIVLGAPPGRGAAISGPLAARLATAAGLVHEGAATFVLVTGDGGRRVDEISVMVDALLAHGVPASMIRVDGEGYRTLTSLARARAVFDVVEAYLVTNPFHLPRALYLARRVGIDAIGVPALESPRPRRRRRLARVVREGLAFGRAVVDVQLLTRAARGRGAPDRRS